jgi:hypothetical protein
VFFRAKTLGQAVAMCRSLFGLAVTTPASDAPAGLMYTPFHVTVFVLAAALVWGAPNTWAFTARLSLPRAVGAVGLLVLSLLLMWTQSANPFLYFQF